MKILKRNQIYVFILALALITVGYLSQTEQVQEKSSMVSGNVSEEIENVSTIGDATFVSSGAIVDNDETQNSISTVAETKDDYFDSSKIERDKMYSEQLESYQKMIESTTITNEQKAIAENEIKKINDNKNAIMIIENLIKTKGFSDIVVFINRDSVNAIVKSDKLESQDIAQIQNIISRELKADINNIHISNK